MYYPKHISKRELDLGNLYCSRYFMKKAMRDSAKNIDKHCKRAIPGRRAIVPSGLVLHSS